MFIVPFRRVVTDLLEARVSVPVYGYLPDDPAHLPCHVVGRPTVRETATPGVMTTSLDVSLLGRRISDDDSQAELDALADELFVTLGGTRNVRTAGLQLRCTLLLPATVVVAALEYPAYVAAVSQEIVSC